MNDKKFKKCRFRYKFLVQKSAETNFKNYVTVAVSKKHFLVIKT